MSFSLRRFGVPVAALFALVLGVVLGMTLNYRSASADGGTDKRPIPPILIPVDVQPTFRVQPTGILHGLAHNGVRQPGQPEQVVSFKIWATYRGVTVSRELTASPNLVAPKAESAIMAFYSWRDLFGEEPCGPVHITGRIFVDGRPANPPYEAKLQVATGCAPAK